MTASLMPAPQPEATKFPAFTPRQWEGSYRLWKGKTNWEIGTIVHCREGTVKKHLQPVYEKLGVEPRAAAIKALDEFKDARQWRVFFQQDADQDGTAI